MSNLEKLKMASTLSELALLLGFKPASVSYLLYKKAAKDKYEVFEVKKKSGGVREICAPSEELKLLQKRVSEYLANCLSEIEKKNGTKRAISHGFRKGYSIITNAKVHKKRKYVFNLDLEDFFGHINFGRVRGFFIKNREFELHEKVATVLAQIACHDNSLPQGSPCSPIISNLITHALDIDLAKLAHRCGCSYSRYADDLTFSTNKKRFPSSIAADVKEEHHWEAGPRLLKAIGRHGFSINPQKTRMQYRGTRQAVTGLVVNKKVSIKREYWRNARAMANELFSTGEFYINRVRDEDGIEERFIGSLPQLEGYLNFVDTVDKHNAKIKEEHQKKNKPTNGNTPLNTREKTYLQFVFYKNFYANERPIIVCEGKTDNVYLKSAIYSLNKKFPLLATSFKDKLERNITFYNHLKNASRLGLLSGGAAHLDKFVGQYKSFVSRYQAPGMRQPVILVVDYDSAGKSVIRAGLRASKKKGTGDFQKDKPFHYFFDNLYLVMVPSKSGDDAAIETLFPKNVLDVKIDGKSFCMEKSMDPKIHYGKHIFSERIVRKNADKIDFSGFEPLLKAIEDVIVDYKHKRAEILKKLD